MSLIGITDLQLLENASRSDDKTYIRSLDKSVQNDLKLGFMETKSWLSTKQDIGKIMYTEVFSLRPLQHETIEYCQNDVIHMPALREIYMARIKPEWLYKAKDEIEHRITRARSPEYDP